MMQIRSPHPDPEPMLEINTTPLIDVMLVLLVMLIITIPTAWQSTELNLVQGHAQQAPASVIQIHIDAQGQWIWNGQVLIQRQELDARLEQVARDSVQPVLELRAAPHAPYGQVLAVLAKAQNLGLTKLKVHTH